MCHRKCNLIIIWNSALYISYSNSLHDMKPCFCNLTSELLADEACTCNYEKYFI
uniref:Uncharacterized protein n=1 Tax=Sphaeramia orbicularis TaxID=375764 RepID=A0A672YSH1_9TELE